MSDPKQQLETLRAKLENGERGGSDADRDVLLRFDNRMALLREDYGYHRRLKLMRHGVIMSEEAPAPLSAVIEDEDAAEDIVRWIHDNYDNEETNRDYRSALRVLGRRVTEGDDVPDALSWISTRTSRDYKPRPNPAEMLRWDEAQAMIDTTQQSRDAALIALQFEAGLRGGELYDLTVGDVTESKHGLHVYPNGKTGGRSVTLIQATPWVQRWMTDHPAPEDDDAPFWSHLGKAEQISYSMFLRIPREAKKRADVPDERVVHMTGLRQANLRWLVINGTNARVIEQRQGREPGSEHVSRYMSEFGPESAEALYAESLGLEVETEETLADEDPPVRCPHCTQSTPADRTHCIHCYHAISYDVDDSERGPEDLSEQELETIRKAYMAVRDLR